MFVLSFCLNYNFVEFLFAYCRVVIKLKMAKLSIIVIWFNIKKLILNCMIEHYRKEEVHEIYEEVKQKLNRNSNTELKSFPANTKSELERFEE